MYQVKVTKGDYNALAESGTRAGHVLGCFASEAEAQAMAAAFAADTGIKCKVSAYKLTPREEARAKLMASLGLAYVPKHVEPAGRWVRA